MVSWSWVPASLGSSAILPSSLTQVLTLSIPGGIGDLLGAAIAGRRDGRFDGLDLKGRLF